MNLTKRILPGLAALTVVASMLTGCGGDGGRPSVDEISDSIQDGDGVFGGGDVDDKTADCLAKAFHDSDLSDDALQAIVDQDEDYEPSDDDEKAAESLSGEAMGECITDNMDLPDTEDLETPEAS